MGNTTKSKNVFMLYMRDVCRYDIKDLTGSNNRIVNIIDAVVYIVYLGITFLTLWINGINTLPFISTVLLIIRSFLKNLKLYNKLRSGGNNVAFAFVGRMIVYAVVILFIGISYFAIGGDIVGKVLLSICYVLFALFELTDILADCFDAAPHVYRR